MTETHPFASARRRLLAALIDIFIVLGISLFLSIPFGSAVELNVSFSSGGVWRFSYINGHIFFIAFLSYFLLCDALGKRSVGKKILGLRIVSVTKEALSRKRLVLRTFAKLGDFIFMCGLPLILIWGKTLGDVVGNTQVVYVKGTKTDPSPKESSPVKKGIGILFLLFSIWLWSGIILHIPKIIKLSRTAEQTWQNIHQATTTNHFHDLYSNSAAMLREEISEENFGLLLQEIKKQQHTSSTITPASYKIRSWLFTDTLAETQGVVDDRYPFNLTFTQNHGEWQLAGFRSPNSQRK